VHQPEQRKQHHHRGECSSGSAVLLQQCTCRLFRGRSNQGLLLTVFLPVEAQLTCLSVVLSPVCRAVLSGDRW